MYFVCKISNLLLLFYIECSFIYTVCHYFISKLSTCQMMKYKTVLSCIDYFSVVKCFEFINKLCFICQFGKCIDHSIIYFFCSIIIIKSLCHRNAVIFHTLCSLLTGHCFCKIHTFYICKLLIRSQGICVLPIYHSDRFLLYSYLFSIFYLSSIPYRI